MPKLSPPVCGATKTSTERSRAALSASSSGPSSSRPGRDRRRTPPGRAAGTAPRAAGPAPGWPPGPAPAAPCAAPGTGRSPRPSAAPRHPVPGRARLGPGEGPEVQAVRDDCGAGPGRCSRTVRRAAAETAIRAARPGQGSGGAAGCASRVARGRRSAAWKVADNRCRARAQQRQRDSDGVGRLVQVQHVEPAVVEPGAGPAGPRRRAEGQPGHRAVVPDRQRAAGAGMTPVGRLPSAGASTEAWCPAERARAGEVADVELHPAGDVQASTGRPGRPASRCAPAGGRVRVGGGPAPASGRPGRPAAACASPAGAAGSPRRGRRRRPGSSPPPSPAALAPAGGDDLWVEVDHGPPAGRRGRPGAARSGSSPGTARRRWPGRARPARRPSAPSRRRAAPGRRWR